MINNICPICMGALYLHPTLPKYRKCDTCAYTVKEKSRLMLSQDDILTSSGKYPERAKSPECTQEIKDNVVKLIVAVNSLLEDLGIKEVKVSSGFRTSAVNAGIANAAKRSSHMTGNAVDLEDHDGSLNALILSKPDLLHKHQLWMEDGHSTEGWTHLDRAIRTDRPLRVFKP